MKKTLVSLRRRWITRQAAQWHVRMQHPQSEREVEAFEAWLDAHPSHPSAYADIETLMRSGERASWAKASIAGRHLRPALAIAIIAALIMCSTLLFAFPSSHPAIAAVSNLGPGVRTVALTDGGEVVLDVGTEVGLLVTDTERRIEVRTGRARIDATLDGHRPVTIVMPDGEARIASGVVDIMVQRDRSLLTAVEKPVRLALGSGLDDIGLEGGETLRVATTGYDRIRGQQTDPTWPAARQAFERTPLGEIAALANRYGHPPIVIDDDQVANLTVTGVFDLRDTRSLASKIAAALNLETDARADAIFLSR